MLTEGQQRYVDTLPETDGERIVHIKPWNHEGFDTATKIIQEIKTTLPDHEVELTGSLAYKIAGEVDIDITIYCPKDDQDTCRTKLSEYVGQWKEKFEALTTWKIEKDGFPVGIWLVDPDLSPSAKANRDLAEAFKSNPELLKEYEELKLSMNGKTYKEYQTAKYKFYNRALDRSIP